MSIIKQIKNISKVKIMKSFHNQLEKYSRQCDELVLNKHLKSLLNKASKSIESIEVEDLYILDNKLILIDVREPEEFSSGYINAHTILTIPRGKLEFMAIDRVAKKYGQDSHIVTYCLKGSRGLLAAYQLKKLGFTNVRNLNGGIINWLAKGNTIHSYLGELTLA